MPTNQFSCNSWSQCGKCPPNKCTCVQPVCGTCLQMVSSDCVFYTGTTTPCLHLTTGSTLSQIINSLDAVICSINPSGTNPSGCCSTVTGTTNQIVITTSGSLPNLNYQVGLSNVITNEISTIQSQINSISNFLLTTITSITTNTPQSLAITNPSTNVWNIDYISNPSGQSGILYSDYSDSTTVNTSWTTVKTYSVIAGTLSTNGDKLVAVTRFTCANPSGSQVRVQFNNTTIQAISTFSISNLNAYEGEIWIVRQSNTAVNIIFKAKAGTDNGTIYQQLHSEFSYVIPMAGLNLTSNSYSINCDIKSVTAGDTICRFLEVEYKKKI